MSSLELGQAIALTQQESRARAIAELDAAKKIAFVAIPDDPLDRFVMVNKDGVASEPVTPPPSRLDVLVQSLSLLKNVALTFEVKTLLVSPNRVLGLVDAKDRRDRIKLPLPFSNEFRLVAQWSKRTALSQTDLVRLLRLELAECCTTDSAKQLLKFAESFSVVSAGTQQATVKRDRESLGRSIDDSVRAEAGDCPDAVILQVRVHTDNALQAPHNIHVAVDFSPSSQQFFLMAGEADLRVAVEAQIQTAINVLTTEFGANCPSIIAADLPDVDCD